MDRVVDCLVRCVGAAEGPSCGLLVPSCLVVRVGRRNDLLGFRVGLESVGHRLFRSAGHR